MQEIVYVGNELELFQHAAVWKNYYGRMIKHYLNGKVLEVGAGIGSTTQHLCEGHQEKWLCLEPDPDLYSKLESKIVNQQLPACCSSLKGTTRDLSLDEKYNAIIYIDVIEHIEKDAAELDQAKKLLLPGGYLIVLVPAHQSLYSAFDKAIGHYRRYDKPMLKATAPTGLQLEEIRYLDSCGLLASVVNKYFLKQDYPTIKQIKFWDTFMVRLSKFTDVVTGYALGKTVIAIWKNN
jgi:ubiquinone/menaquinone biosynthesis C-methylase UbiE